MKKATELKNLAVGSMWERASKLKDRPSKSSVEKRRKKNTKNINEERLWDLWIPVSRTTCKSWEFQERKRKAMRVYLKKYCLKQGKKKTTQIQRQRTEMSINTRKMTASIYIILRNTYIYIYIFLKTILRNSGEKSVLI